MSLILRIIIRILINALALYAAVFLIPGISYNGHWLTLIIAGAVLGIINFLVKPIITFFSLPIIFLTLGLFLLIINVFCLMLVTYIVPGLEINGFFPALFGVIIIWIINAIVSTIVERDEK